MTFALATVATGCARDAIRIRYRGNMVKGFDERDRSDPDNKKPRTLSGTGRLLVAHPS
jgi:hypothetical protein